VEWRKETKLRNKSISGTLPESWLDANTFRKIAIQSHTSPVRAISSERSFLRFKWGATSFLFDLLRVAARSGPLIPYWYFMQRGQSASHNVDLGPHPNAYTKGSEVRFDILQRTGLTSRCLGIYGLSLIKTHYLLKELNLSERQYETRHYLKFEKRTENCRKCVILFLAEANRSNYLVEVITAPRGAGFIPPHHLYRKTRLRPKMSKWVFPIISYTRSEVCKTLKIHATEENGVAVTPSTCIQEVVVRITAVTLTILKTFLVFWITPGTLLESTSITSWPLPFRSCPLHHSSSSSMAL
jgi:hypothetical protein